MCTIFNTPRVRSDYESSVARLKNDTQPHRKKARALKSRRDIDTIDRLVDRSLAKTRASCRSSVARREPALCVGSRNSIPISRSIPLRREYREEECFHLDRICVHSPESSCRSFFLLFSTGVGGKRGDTHAASGAASRFNAIDKIR